MVRNAYGFAMDCHRVWAVDSGIGIRHKWARWETRQHLEAFCKSAEGQANPYGDPPGIEHFEEVDDLIVDSN